jgi:pyruvate/2-oxoglutarate dehydrogenase complex dihydrolipoamide dehydrogenase (E3) component
VTRHDVVVIGGGAGGLTAAREANRRGARTLLISDGPLGGDCTHTGCVPSKTLLDAAARGRSFAEAMATVHRRIEEVAATEDADTLAREGIEVLDGRATLTGGHGVDVDGRRIEGRHIILATGARAAVPPIPGLREQPHLTNESIFALQSQPRRLAVLGGGAIGVELAQAFRGLGSEVTVVEAEPRLLVREEPEVSAVIEERFAAAGIDVRTGARVEQVERTETGDVRLRVGDGTTVLADHLLVATGRVPTTDGLGLADAGVEIDERGFIATDESLATTAPGIWAIGDVTGRMPFTHAAGRMAFVAVANALSRVPLRKTRFDPTPIPWVTFTSPEVARIGMTEAEAADHGGRVAYLPLSEVDRGIITGDTDGFVKLVAGPRRLLRNAGGGRLLGATIVAPTAGEMIGQIALAMRTGMFTGRLAQTTQAYPTWSMAIQETAAQFFMTRHGRTARDAEA